MKKKIIKYEKLQDIKYYLEGNLENVICLLSNWKENFEEEGYFNLIIDIYWTEDGIEADIKGDRYETDNEFNKRQLKIQKDKENAEKSKAKKKEKEKKLYLKLKQKYEGKEL